METEKEVKIELKYCERCGGLFLRHASDPEVYCGPCAPEVRDMAAPRKKPAASERWNRAMAEVGGVACA